MRLAKVSTVGERMRGMQKPSSTRCHLRRRTPLLWERELLLCSECSVQRFQMVSRWVLEDQEKYHLYPEAGPSPWRTVIVRKDPNKREEAFNPWGSGLIITGWVVFEEEGEGDDKVEEEEEGVAVELISPKVWPN